MSEAPHIAEAVSARPVDRDHTSVLPRILLVDDDDAILRFGKQCLRLAGYAVDTAPDGAAGWQALRAGSYDLLITDHEMPRASGLELLALLHAFGLPVPAILVSATPPVEQLKRAPWLQPKATLRKPFSVEEYLDAVAGVLADARAAAKGAGEFRPAPAFPEPRGGGVPGHAADAEGAADFPCSRRLGRRARPVRRRLVTWSAEHGIMELQTPALPVRRRTRRSL